ncbi:asparagine synthase (glutamine-hydrolyzing) [Methanocalculus taiwanensis]|uniref:Putative asparagine synthetase [glutamine-hydrolyzing] n=1 Tax=Methanocalculus taiwanensis TaxID=106207 RepID=A0ABD4TNN2_9EURY|nr:asparagine synthase (glutamine-hydrolyzing) [Methanocalculus taiwanensis]MCQ1539373.1 asparagine synthase (glutamine-hydrolyzing) [Methanocalculus taiwanensis]
MCGIAGQITIDGSQIDPNLLHRMSKTLAHRGPDSEGIYFNNQIGLAHRRLAIIDLSDTGRQPMSNPDETIWIIYNGEIYNYKELQEELRILGHKFRSESDTEVIIHAYEEWGSDCLSRFNGMWAFALWDSRREELFCARDRLGIKPFYYSIIKGSFLFASEIKALREHPGVGRCVNESRLSDFLTWALADHTDETLFDGIFQLLPGHTLTVTRNGVGEQNPYWEIFMNPALKTTEGSDEEHAEEFLALMTDAVMLHLRSDVPVGTCLSGGLDSSTLTALINRVLRSESPERGNELQNTFSACFSDRRFDESEYIDIIAEDTQVKSHPTYPGTETIWEDLYHLLSCNDEPFASLTIYSQYCVMREASKRVKVVLDGQGADELLGGYIAYHIPHLRGLIRAGHPATTLKELFGILRHHRIFFWYALHQVINRKRRRRLIRIARTDPLPRYQGTLGEALRIDLTRANLPYMLHWEDRTSMAFSIESRVPFLDYRVVEYLASLPEDQKIREGITKYILRKATKKLLPEAIRCRMDKRGFSTPEEVWMKEGMQPEILKIFASPSFRSRPYWNADEVHASYRDFIEGRSSYSGELWRIICTELWLRQCIDMPSTEAK